MPYIIHVPGRTRPYITNDPRIYLDCSLSFGWQCESRPFSDPYCKEVVAAENMRNKGERRRDQLTHFWEAELDRRARLRAAANGSDVSLGVVELLDKPATLADECRNETNAKRDSVMSVVVEIKEVKGDDEEPELEVLAP